ncbi:ATP-dependent RecD-like DNA helicase [Chlorobium phaeovibrioides]|uniref:ATP-dependent RecD2 DNA helicase n=1 Tax=Chlorobium phaeovibrioides TaxID=1094 RepID=A0A432AWH0_CHLPH|nr:ATP-dependent RecD-like DNA helicase [Chlorobium phaeovibrioides]MWV54841.1 ATP-dependent RecD-like DNA helicase [Chlorobium phaeovibrioides]QEQ56679.1 ATP-dependent RecD-like DNA helicase [Chlorobium phaeovibrioides]RTY35329.1 ATP-dependent RecD-like DNA helicase [Chlorobium phaeovibrioides]RTY38876.1 ATP-dependent RecD-like DNA helicase [Chlorobium phaeovibrioides]
MHREEANGAGDERLSGVVDRVSFFSPESGFAVLRLSSGADEAGMTVVGCIASVSPGQHIEAVGRWQNDRNWGMQFRASTLSVVAPRSHEGMENYLASGMLKGVGPHLASVMMGAWGTDVFTIIEGQPERLLELPGIGPKKQRQIVESWQEHKAVRDIMIFLQSHGVGTARALKIYKVYGADAVAVVSRDPYRLTRDISGIGFRTADAIALSIGIARDSPLRARAGISWVLQELSSRGHCRVPETMLLDSARQLLQMREDILQEALKSELTVGHVIAEGEGEDRHLYLESLWKAEQGVAEGIKRIASGKLPWGRIDVDRSVREAEERSRLELSPSQREAVRLALTSKLLVITGGPGVGKTTIIRTLLSIPEVFGLSVLLCAPTGRAAKRLGEATGREGRTIHRMLEFDPYTYDFKRCSSNPLNADIIIVDEASMIDVVLMNRLLSAISSKAAVVLAGDVDQLPPVGPGAVLADVISSEAVPVVRLTEIFRQAAQSMIIQNAHRINRGEGLLRHEGPELTDFYFVSASGPEEIRRKLLSVVAQRIPERFGLDPLEGIQVLTPMNKGPLGSQSLNTLLQERLNGGGGKRVERFAVTYGRGDKVIQTINNYEKEVFNGDIGIISAIDDDDREMQVLFDGREVRYLFSELDEMAPAWAITIHKSQGSEYPAVVIPLSMLHYPMLERNLIYTAVTRGRKLVMVIGEEQALATAIARCTSKGRLTGLAAALRLPIG